MQEHEPNIADNPFQTRHLLPSLQILQVENTYKQALET